MKNNYLKKLLPTLTMLLCSVVANAHYFEVDGIYYDFSGNNEVSVTYKGNDYDSYENEYSGNVVIPETVTYNGKTYSVTSIGYSAFYGCTNLTSITIPNSVTSIEGSAFSNCTNLTSVTIPNSVTSIGYNAFEGTTWYNNQPDGFVYAGKVLYKYKGTMPSGTSINIKEGTLGIAGGAFYDCTGLTSVTIPNSVTNIGGSAFCDCSGLTSVTIGNGITSMEVYAFGFCRNLKAVYINDITAWCNIEFKTGGWYPDTNPLYYAKNLYLNEELVTELAIPESVSNINDDAFINCTSLTGVKIPNSVTSIGRRAFESCTGLTSVTIGNSVTSIEESAFYGCTGLTSITIPNSVTSIGGSAFSGCDGLTSITIPNSVTSIRYSAFNGCTGLTSITIPNSVTSIEENAFMDCTGLTSITIPNSVTSIGSSAFENCISLTSITIHNSVTSIENYAFEGCTGLTSITIPNSVTSIENYAFRDCSGLKKVIIGNSVTSIEESAFEGCDNIFRLLWLCKTPPEGYKNLKASMNYVANDEFTGLENMVVVPYISSAFEVDDVMYVPTNPQKRTCDIIDYSGTNDTIIIGERVNYKGVEMTVENIMPYSFYNSGAIDYLSINCNTIGENCFVSSTDIKTIILGEKLSSIGDNLFSTCNKLQKIYCNATVPPTCGKNVFKDVDKWNCELYVPAESMADYQTADVWNEFFLINEIPTGIEDVAEEVAPAFEVTDGGIKLTAAEGKAVAVYSTAGALVEKIDSYAGEEITLDKGVYIVRVGGKAVKVKL